MNSYYSIFTIPCREDNSSILALDAGAPGKFVPVVSQLKYQYDLKLEEERTVSICNFTSSSRLTLLDWEWP